ncbi:hypothetical protein PG994_005496 [Apiospora phragmitis]|uniref:Ankyrin n=1 Tax=Apiospora phragmitis TaxID=2905665 RepID=A0ABR1VCF8_9PEZI
MSSQTIPGPAKASHHGQLSPKRICLPPEIHQMIFNAIDNDSPNDRPRTALSVMLANKKLHGIWNALVHAVLHGFLQPMRDIVGIGTTAKGKSADMNVQIELSKEKEWWKIPIPTHNGYYLSFTPLHAAVALSDEETVRFLLQNGADANRIGYSAEYEVDPGKRSGQGLYMDEYNSYTWTRLSFESAIHMATCQGHLPIVQLLVNAKSTLLWDPEQAEEKLGADMSSVVLSLLQFPSNISMACQLLTQASWKVDLGANVQESNGGTCSLADAILELYLSLNIEDENLCGWRLVLRTALAGGANINCLHRQTYLSSEKPLLEICFMYTAGEKGLILMELLLEKGAQVQTRLPHGNIEEPGNSLLLWYLKDGKNGLDAERRNRGQVPTQALRKRAGDKISLGDDTSNAAERKVKALLAAGIRVDGVDDLGWTSLGIACLLVTSSKQPLEFMKKLLDAGADPNQQAVSGLSNGITRSPMAVCFSNNYSYRACKLLQMYGGTLHKDDDLKLIEGQIQNHMPSGGRNRVTKLFKKLASQVEGN